MDSKHAAAEVAMLLRQHSLPSSPSFLRSPLFPLSRWPLPPFRIPNPALLTASASSCPLPFCQRSPASLALHPSQMLRGG